LRNYKYVISMAVIIILAVVAVACGGGETEVVVDPAATLVDATAAPVNPEETVVAATVENFPTSMPEEVVVVEMWPQVQEAGVLTIGTSSGYPPFEYIDAQTF